MSRVADPRVQEEESERQVAELCETNRIQENNNTVGANDLCWSTAPAEKRRKISEDSRNRTNHRLLVTENQIQSTRNFTNARRLLKLIQNLIIFLSLRTLNDLEAKIKLKIDQTKDFEETELKDVDMGMKTCLRMLIKKSYVYEKREESVPLTKLISLLLSVTSALGSENLIEVQSELEKQSMEYEDMGYKVPIDTVTCALEMMFNLCST